MKSGCRGLGLLLAAMLSTGCSRAPSFDVLGSFFPAWLVCLALGLLLTVAAHWLLLRTRVVLAVPILTYPSLTAIVHIRALAGFFSIARKLMDPPIARPEFWLAAFSAL